MMIDEARVVEMLREAGAKGPLAPNWVSYISEFLSSGRVGQDSPEKHRHWTALELRAQKASDELQRAVAKLADAYRIAASAAEDQGSAYDNKATFSPFSCGNSEALTAAADEMSKWIEAAPIFHPKDRKQNYLGEVIVALDAMVKRAGVDRRGGAARVRFIFRALKACGTQGAFSEDSIGQSIKRAGKQSAQPRRIVRQKRVQIHT